MRDPGKPITILLADDDEEDRMLTHDALEESRTMLIHGATPRKEVAQRLANVLTSARMGPTMGN